MIVARGARYYFLYEVGYVWRCCRAFMCCVGVIMLHCVAARTAVLRVLGLLGSRRALSLLLAVGRADCSVALLVSLIVVVLWRVTHMLCMVLRRCRFVISCCDWAGRGFVLRYVPYGAHLRC